MTYMNIFFLPLLSEKAFTTLENKQGSGYCRSLTPINIKYTGDAVEDAGF